MDTSTLNVISGVVLAAVGVLGMGSGGPAFFGVLLSDQIRENKEGIASYVLRASPQLSHSTTPAVTAIAEKLGAAE